ncbi:MAG: kelch repeat-containing protein [Idiomarina sp.]
MTNTLAEARYGHAAVADNKAIYVIGGANKSGLFTSIEIIDPETGKTTVLPNKLIPRRYLSAAWDGKESIYIFGGMSHQNRKVWQEKAVEVFNTRTHEVTKTIQMPAPRQYNSAVLLNDKIYLVGGSIIHPSKTQKGIQLLATPLTTALDLTTNKWSRLANLPIPVNTRAFAVTDKICAIGGYDGFNQFPLFNCYNETTNSWEAMPDAPDSVSAHSVVTHNNKLYVFGDYDNLDQVLVYDFTDNAWSYADLPYQASRHNAAVVFGDQLFVIGGNTGRAGPVLDSIQVFSVLP